MLSIRLGTFLTNLGLAATLWAASSRPADEPVGTPASGVTSHSLGDPVSLEAPGDSMLPRRTGFEVVPGKDPNGWSFILEPYLCGRWAWTVLSG